MNSRYKAYLVRLQRSHEQAHWRVTLENVHSGELLRFATEQAFLQHLKLILSGRSSKSDSPKMEEDK